MKSWTDRQVFFVFDTEYCQNEEDDPKDAIVYFYPQDTTDNVRCTLCCQLMGMCRFMASCFSPVSLIRLDKGKFAIRAIDKFTVALKGNKDMPDTVLQRQLLFLIRLFVFYYKDFDTVWHSVGENRPDFIRKMSVIWSHLLSISQHGGNTISLTFDITPSILLPKSAGLLFLQTSQLLQACQRFRGVHGGCLFCDKQVLFSQLSSSLLGKLSFVWQKLKVPGEQVDLNFELPGGVMLVTVYLTQNEMHELDLISLDGELSSQSNEEDSRPATSISSTEPNQSYPDSAVLESSSQSSSSETTLTQSNDFATKSCTEDSYRGPSVNTLLTDCTEPRTSSVDEGFDELFNLQPKILYLQEYNDTTLILILDLSCQDNSQTFHGLWKLCTSTMMSLETDVKSCLDNTPKPKTKTSDLNYLYLQFDKIWQRAQGNIFNNKEPTIQQQLFSQTSQLLHEDFIKEPQTYETTIRTQDLVIYGHVLGSRETYFHTPSYKQSGSSNSSGSKQPIHVGFPLQTDLTANISVKAKRKLLKEQRLVLL